ncbi:MAG: C cytochrome precursor, partial [Hydrogenophaga sp.]|uniref:hypothetical protein n=1 Tax=Hydrogenophaga sp. TaxID=1904254 RepID=UPI0016981F0D
AAEHLEAWYGQPHHELTGDDAEVSAAVRWLLSGHANQRALIAWHMGWGPAQQASGKDWLGAYLGHTLADPYSCVRYIAHRSLRRLPGFADFEFDFVGPPNDRSAARARAVAH